jgi:predicted GH43/DUF377 family glycosyl hydrolase
LGTFERKTLAIMTRTNKDAEMDIQRLKTKTGKKKRGINQKEYKKAKKWLAYTREMLKWAKKAAAGTKQARKKTATRIPAPTPPKKPKQKKPRPKPQKKGRKSGLYWLVHENGNK